MIVLGNGLFVSHRHAFQPMCCNKLKVNAYLFGNPRCLSKTHHLGFCFIILQLHPLSKCSWNIIWRTHLWIQWNKNACVLSNLKEVLVLSLDWQIPMRDSFGPGNTWKKHFSINPTVTGGRQTCRELQPQPRG